MVLYDVHFWIQLNLILVPHMTNIYTAVWGCIWIHSGKGYSPEMANGGREELTSMGEFEFWELCYCFSQENLHVQSTDIANDL